MSTQTCLKNKRKSRRAGASLTEYVYIHIYIYIYIAAFIGKDPKHINVQKTERIFFPFFFKNYFHRSILDLPQVKRSLTRSPSRCCCDWNSQSRGRNNPPGSTITTLPRHPIGKRVYIYKVFWCIRPRACSLDRRYGAKNKKIGHWRQKTTEPEKVRIND
jgi:hypothetical protein